MSSLRDDLNSRVYASESGALRVCHCSTCDALPEPACSVCKADEIPLDFNDLSDEYLCATCAPREGETCGDYIARCREIRSAK